MSPARSREPLERDAAGARILTHGTGGYARGCGCDACTEDHTTAERDQRAAASQAAGRGTPADEDKRLIPVTIKLSQRETDELDRQAGNDTRSAYTRNALLAALGIEDTARRPTPRRRNQKGNVT